MNARTGELGAYCRSRGKMQLIDTEFSGVHLVRSDLLEDSRGRFLKLWHQGAFAGILPNYRIHEIYVSRSRRGAIRGLHFQIPPHAHDKLIFCLAGKIFDVCVDLRRSSGTYGKHFQTELGEGQGILVPQGFAHGLQALTDDTLMMNATSAEYAPEYERGVSWDSCGIAWPIANPLLSEKDKSQPPIANIDSPFA